MRPVRFSMARSAASASGLLLELGLHHRPVAARVEDGDLDLDEVARGDDLVGNALRRGAGTPCTRAPVTCSPLGTTRAAYGPNPHLHRLAIGAGDDRRHDVSRRRSAAASGSAPRWRESPPGRGSRRCPPPRRGRCARRPEPAALVVGAQPRLDRPGGRLLKPHVQGGVDAKPFLVEPLHPVLLLQVLADLLDEVGGDGVAPLLPLGEHDGRAVASSASASEMKPSSTHPPQNEVAAAHRHVHVDERARPRRSREGADDGGRLAELELGRGLVEVESRSGLDPERAVPGRAQPDLVGVERQDLALRIALLDLDRVEGPRRSCVATSFRGRGSGRPA